MEAKKVDLIEAKGRILVTRLGRGIERDWVSGTKIQLDGRRLF